MAENSGTHRCTSCRATTSRWAGRCGACGAWNTMEPDLEARPHQRGRTSPGARASAASAATSTVPLRNVDPTAAAPIPTGLAEVDRVLTGGLVPGSVTLVFGEPGVGKSTLLLQVLASVSADERPVVLVSAEESAAQVRARAERIGPLPADLLVCATADVGTAVQAVVEQRPDLVVVDSVQTIADLEVAGGPGSLTQVRSCVDRLAAVAKLIGCAVVLVGHVTKDGDLAGPRALEHLVDTVLAFEGDRHHSLRLLRAVKHRFGPTGEVGLFEMGPSGLEPVGDTGPLLLGDRRVEVPGSAVVALLQGRRPLLVELQALASKCEGPGQARRNVQGVDARRLAMLLAVLECRAGISTSGYEVFVSATGGVAATEPAADLALALAVASTVTGHPLPDDVVAVGEIGLAGEVRQVPGTDRRLIESARLGFAYALVPAGTPESDAPIKAIRIGTLDEAVMHLCGGVIAAPARSAAPPRPASRSIVPIASPTATSGSPGPSGRRSGPPRADPADGTRGGDAVPVAAGKAGSDGTIRPCSTAAVSR